MSWLKSALTSPLGNTCLGAVVGAMERLGPGADLLRILTYHRVDVAPSDTAAAVADRDHHDPRLISATPAEFAEHMDWIAEHDVAVSLNEVLDALRGESSLKPGAVLITFDDANRCLAEHAWPILKQRQLPATVFVPTDYPDSTAKFWWDRVYTSVMQTALTDWSDGEMEIRLSTPNDRRDATRQIARRFKSMPHHEGSLWLDEVCAALGEVEFENNILSWDDLRRLALEGVVLAPHTKSHPLLTQISLEEAREEVVGSYQALKAEIDQIVQVPKVLAYPGGDHNKAVAEMLAEEGFEAAFTVQRGINSIERSDRFRLRRINVGQGTKLALLRAQMLPQVRHFSRALGQPS